jgi:hypothetical protein
MDLCYYLRFSALICGNDLFHVYIAMIEVNSSLLSGVSE